MTNTFLDAGNKTFLQVEKKIQTNNDDDDEDGNGALVIPEQEGESDRDLLLEYLKVIQEDIELYLGDHSPHYISKNWLLFPDDSVKNMKVLGEEYIYVICLEFMRYTLKRKNFDYDSRELQFYLNS